MRRSMFHITAMGYLLVLSFLPFLDSHGNTRDFQVLGDLKKLYLLTLLYLFYQHFDRYKFVLLPPPQGWEFAYSLIAHSLISPKSNEQLWVIHSRQMSDCEWITQDTHIKRVTVSESLRLLMTNEQLWVICSGCSPKISEWVIWLTIFGKKI